MAEAGGQVVKVVVPALMPACVVRIDAGKRVKEGEEGSGGGEMRGPVRGYAADAIGAVEGGGRGAGVSRFQRVNCYGLDVKGEVGGWVVHHIDDHASDLGGNHIVRDSVGYFIA